MLVLRLLIALLLLVSCTAVQARELVDTTATQTLSNKTLDATNTITPITGTCTLSVGGNATYTTNICRWSKLGKQVTVQVIFTINVIGTGSTSIISGLPFPVDATAYGMGPVYFNGLAISVVNVVPLVGAGGSTSFALYSIVSAGASVTLNAILGNGSSIITSFTYTSAS